MSALSFHTLAPRYDALWTATPIGRAQREAVWARIDSLFRRGDRILDLGCGTGEDAKHLMARGVQVLALDAAPAMVDQARAKGVDAHVLAIEDLRHLQDAPFDGALSNFGALNCVGCLTEVAHQAARLLRPGAYLAICLMSPTCAWDVASPRHALRRLRPGGSASSLGVRVRYPSVACLTTAFRPHFELRAWYGIGLAVPPSYIKLLSEEAVARCAAVDRRIAHWPVLRALADHRLLVFRRL